MIFTRKFLWTLSALALLSYQSAHAMDKSDDDKSHSSHLPKTQNKGAEIDLEEMALKELNSETLSPKVIETELNNVKAYFILASRPFHLMEEDDSDSDSDNEVDDGDRIIAMIDNSSSIAKILDNPSQFCIKKLFHLIQNKKEPSIYKTKKANDSIKGIPEIKTREDLINNILKIIFSYPKQNFDNGILCPIREESFQTIRKNAESVCKEWKELIEKKEREWLCAYYDLDGEDEDTFTLLLPRSDCQDPFEMNLGELLVKLSFIRILQEIVFNEEKEKEEELLLASLSQFRDDFEKQNPQINFSLRDFIQELGELKTTPGNERARSLYEKFKTCKTEHTNIDKDTIVLLLNRTQGPVEWMEEAEHKKISPRLKYFLETGIPQTIIFLGSIQDMIGTSNEIFKINNICSTVSNLNLKNIKKIVFKITSQEELYLAVKGMSEYYKELTYFYKKAADDSHVGQSNKKQKEPMDPLEEKSNLKAMDSLEEESNLNDTLNIFDIFDTLDKSVPLGKKHGIISLPAVPESWINMLETKARETFKNFKRLRIQITMPGETRKDFIIKDKEVHPIFEAFAETVIEGTETTIEGCTVM